MKSKLSWFKKQPQRLVRVQLHAAARQTWLVEYGTAWLSLVVSDLDWHLYRFHGRLGERTLPPEVRPSYSGSLCAPARLDAVLRRHRLTRQQLWQLPVSNFNQWLLERWPTLPEMGLAERGPLTLTVT